MRFSVMTFNVRGSFHDDGANNWELRRDLNIATLLKNTPDIIGFQELQSGNQQDYKAPLRVYDVEFGPISIRKTFDYHHVPIYWKRDLFEKVDTGGFYLSETPEEFSIGWEAKFPRAVSWVKLRCIEGEFIVLNTHFPHEEGKDDTRTACAELIVRRLRKIAGRLPTIVMADFNALPTSDAYRVFVEAGYTDTYPDAGNTTESNTFHDFKGKTFSHEGIRLDWILTKGFKTVRCTVIDDEEPPIYPSDHYPVITELEWL